jgi:hypothetical protein
LISVVRICPMKDMSLFESLLLYLISSHCMRLPGNMDIYWPVNIDTWCGFIQWCAGIHGGHVKMIFTAPPIPKWSGLTNLDCHGHSVGSAHVGQQWAALPSSQAHHPVLITFANPGKNYEVVVLKNC